MAKNKTSSGAFDVSDLAANAQKKINEINTQTGTAKADRRGFSFLFAVISAFGFRAVELLL